MSDEEKIIKELDSKGGEYHKCRAAHLKKRSRKFKRVKKRILLELINNKYTLPEFPCDPQNIALEGVVFEIKTFVVHGRDILWTGKDHYRPPQKVWVTYESWQLSTHKEFNDRKDGSD